MKAAQFKFPLNTYAKAVELEYGRLESVYLGLYDESSAPEDLFDAQRRLLQRLLDSAGSAPVTVLLNGAGMPPVAELLVKMGHEVVLLASGAEAANGIQIVAQTLTAFDTPQQFDLIIQEGSVHYLDQLAILSKVRLLLKPQGTLLWFNEFIVRSIEPEYSGVSLLSIFTQLAVRLGYEIVARQDFSTAVQPTFPAMLSLLDKHRVAVCTALSISNDSYADSRARLQKLAEKFADSSMGFQLLELQMQPPSMPQERWLDYLDINSFSSNELGGLFEKSFGHNFNPRLWSWKYGAGRGRAIAVRKQGIVVAHYGGAPRDILYFGKAAKAIQICDVMVLPEERRHYGQESLFFKAAATFLEREIGFTVEHLLGFGFPNLKTMQLAVRLGLYEKTDDFVEVLYPSALPTQAVALQMTPVNCAEAVHRQAIDRLWSVMAGEMHSAVIGLRDWTYIKYRYFDHPCAAYQCILLHREGESDAFAFAVLKPHQEGYLLMDVVASQQDLKHAIIGLCAAYQAQPQPSSLRCWITRGWHQAILIDGAEVRELQIEIPCHSWSPGPSAELLYGKWWLSAGDMDFQ